MIKQSGSERGENGKEVEIEWMKGERSYICAGALTSLTSEPNSLLKIRIENC